MSRKDVFGSLSHQAAVPVADMPSSPRPPKGRLRPILGSPELTEEAARSPVGAIGQSLNEVNERSLRAAEIEKRLSEGQVVVSLDAASIDPSFIPDRMPGSTDAHERLKTSLREQGQQVPILVRLHPENPGRYQVAFGHRRLRALTELALPVAAIVRDLTDEQLVVAQGQENNERQDLTYIEKARFAERLQQRFARDVIMASMSLYKSDLSNMLSVVSRIPDDIIDAIGPAPTVGRRSWIDLADILEDATQLKIAHAFLEADEIRTLSSEDRFKQLTANLKPKPSRPVGQVWKTASGVALAKVTASDSKVELVIDRKSSPEFADFVLNRLQVLFEEERLDG